MGLRGDCELMNVFCYSGMFRGGWTWLDKCVEKFLKLEMRFIVTNFALGLKHIWNSWNFELKYEEKIKQRNFTVVRTFKESSLYLSTNF